MCSSLLYPLQRALTVAAATGAVQGLNTDHRQPQRTGRGWQSERKSQRTHRKASSIHAHTVKSTTAPHIGCFYHFGSLTCAPLEAIKFKPQSLLPLLHLTSPPPLKEGRVEEERRGGKRQRVTYCFYMRSIPSVFRSIMT